MSSWAKPGVKCVCVKSTPWVNYVDRGPSRYPIVFPTYRQVLTVREVHNSYGGVGLRFEEIRNEPLWIDEQGNSSEAMFDAELFRPIIEKTEEQDVAKFRHLLSPSPVDVGLIPAGVELVE